MLTAIIKKENGVSIHWMKSLVIINVLILLVIATFVEINIFGMMIIAFGFAIIFVIVILIGAILQIRNMVNMLFRDQLKLAYQHHRQNFGSRTTDIEKSRYRASGVYSCIAPFFDAARATGMPLEWLLPPWRVQKLFTEDQLTVLKIYILILEEYRLDDGGYEISKDIQILLKRIDIVLVEHYL